MSVELLDSATVVSFVEDEEAFGAAIRERFRHLDVDGDGALSYTEMLKEFGSDEVCCAYETESNGKVDLEKFMRGMKKMMMAIAEGLGFLPIHMALQKDGLLMKAVQREAAAMVDA
ncbi:uncharacterized protein LOC111792919 [Cucurbita pepo subsp. pepo]|uniref:Uncharacterized protein LOC111437091 n=1 Tax=Cucurbita moschata TaxID=3662 RepID=A0A6J1ES74_CUCMO|nr:uncharacterized protein LOC111437091 [Cucurbita moschata]XP_023530313.1 uncharacterized protein LOC111792919 [Cucurbita pepo subsp. pepo]